MGGLACCPGLVVVLCFAQSDAHVLLPVGQADRDDLVPVVFEVFECLVESSHDGSLASSRYDGYVPIN